MDITKKRQQARRCRYLQRKQQHKQQQQPTESVANNEEEQDDNDEETDSESSGDEHEDEDQKEKARFCRHLQRLKFEVTIDITIIKAFYSHLENLSVVLEKDTCYEVRSCARKHGIYIVLRALNMEEVGSGEAVDYEDENG